MKLHEIAHSRTGDKGNTSNISVIVYKREDYAWLKSVLTVECVRQHFSGMVRGEVIRYELPELGAFNFVLYDALGGGVTRSLALDAHGKTLSSFLLSLELPEKGQVD
ncbi:MAG TPA: hypothetical protein PK066_02655 [Saprospiraceae bacterium]|nr:hypothetical protein [Saprospiraceae bacterium]